MLHLATLILCLLTTYPSPPKLYLLGGETAAAGVAPGEDWQLTSAGATLAEGRADADGRIEVPPVRGRLSGALIVGGIKTADVILLPATPRETIARLSAKLEIVIVGPGEPLADVLPKARRADRPLALRLSRPDVVIVAPGTLADVSPAEQMILQKLADAGSHVLVLPQDAANIVGVETSDPTPASLKWRGEPPADAMLAVLAPEDLKPDRPLWLLKSDGLQVVAAADEDSAAVARRGNLVFWQIPLDDARLTHLLAATLQETETP